MKHASNHPQSRKRPGNPHQSPEDEALEIGDPYDRDEFVKPSPDDAFRPVLAKSLMIASGIALATTITWGIATDDWSALKAAWIAVCVIIAALLGYYFPKRE